MWHLVLVVYWIGSITWRQISRHICERSHRGVELGLIGVGGHTLMWTAPLPCILDWIKREKKLSINILSPFLSSCRYNVTRWLLPPWPPFPDDLYPEWVGINPFSPNWILSGHFIPEIRKVRSFHSLTCLQEIFLESPSSSWTKVGYSSTILDTEYC